MRLGLVLPKYGLTSATSAGMAGLAGRRGGDASPFTICRWVLNTKGARKTAKWREMNPTLEELFYKGFLSCLTDSEWICGCQVK